MSNDSLNEDCLRDLSALADQITREVPGYNPTRFKKMLRNKNAYARGIVNQLVCGTGTPAGFNRLILAKREDLTVEHFVVHRVKYHSLFGPYVVDAARKRLEFNKKRGF